MNSKILILILIVSVSNILINIFNKRATDFTNSFIESLVSLNFVYAFGFGIISITSMLYLYNQKINLSRGILFMGATSIIIGSVIALIIRKETFSYVEWAMILVLIALYSYKFINT